MSRGFSLIPTQQMRLEQRLTPQLIQSMEILQLPLPALEARIREELASNPVLEEAEPEAPEVAPAPPGEEKAKPEPSNREKEAEAFQRAERLSREYDLDRGDTPHVVRRRDPGERDPKIDAMAMTPSRSLSLQEHLEQQVALMEVSPEIKRAAGVLIEWMDPDGYLRPESGTQPAEPAGEGPPSLVIQRDEVGLQQILEEIARSVSPPIDLHVLEDALWLVQTLEPLGVGARDLTECLLIQLDALPEAPPLATEIVQRHLADVGRHRLPAVAKACGASLDEVKQAVGAVSRLHHHPGLLVSEPEVWPIMPDIIVDYAEDGDGYTVRLARGNSPRLRVSGQYRRMLEESRDDKEAREFIRRHLESASTLIDAIHYRRERLLQLARVVVERQREFLDYGPQFVRVLRMRDLADEFACDPSTISRTVDEKYIQTPRGIFPLRTFFAGGTETSDGEAVSWDRLKAKVKEVIDQEDKRNPLNDDQIAAKMRESGLPISRRTVAKYRAQLNILPAKERQQF